MGFDSVFIYQWVSFWRICRLRCCHRKSTGNREGQHAQQRAALGCRFSEAPAGTHSNTKESSPTSHEIGVFFSSMFLAEKTDLDTTALRRPEHIQTQKSLPFPALPLPGEPLSSPGRSDTAPSWVRSQAELSFLETEQRSCLVS